MSWNFQEEWRNLTAQTKSSQAGSSLIGMVYKYVVHASWKVKIQQWLAYSTSFQGQLHKQGYTCASDIHVSKVHWLGLGMHHVYFSHCCQMDKVSYLLTQGYIYCMAYDFWLNSKHCFNLSILVTYFYIFICRFISLH